MNKDERLKMIRQRHQDLVDAGLVRRHFDPVDDGGFDEFEDDEELEPICIEEDDEWE